MTGGGRLLISLRGLIEASHPYPLLGVLCLTALVGLTADASRPLPLLLALAAMLLSQLAIGWTNDYVDRDRDRVYQPGKPLASGRLSAPVLPPATALVLAGALAAGAVLGLVPLLLLVLGTAAGLSYNFLLKDTRWSWLPFIVAFAALPPFVWSALDAYRSQFALIYVIGLPLVPAVHLANVLPDIATDLASGRRGAGVLLGRTRSLALLFGCLLLSPAFALAAAPWLDYQAALLAAVLAAYALLVLLALSLYMKGARSTAESWAFKPVVAACVLFVGGWLAAL